MNNPFQISYCISVADSCNPQECKALSFTTTKNESSPDDITPRKHLACEKGSAANNPGVRLEVNKTTSHPQEMYRRQISITQKRLHKKRRVPSIAQS